MIFVIKHTISDPEFTFKGGVIKPAHACRYMGEKIDSKLTPKNHLISVSSSTANAFRSLYLARNQVVLKERIDVFQVICSLSSFFQWSTPQTFTANKTETSKQANELGDKILWFSKKLTTPWIFSLRVVVCQPKCLSQNLA